MDSPLATALNESTRSRTRGVVYFVWFPRARRWKIGFTEHSAAARMSGSLTFCPEDAQIIAELPGDPALERELHDRFDAHRVPLQGRNEIFDDCDEIRLFLQNANTFLRERGEHQSLAGLAVNGVRSRVVNALIEDLNDFGFEDNCPARIEIPRENNGAFMRLVSVVEARCTADDVARSWLRFARSNNVELFRASRSQHEWLDRSFVESFWTLHNGAALHQTKGWELSADYLANQPPEQLPFAWVALCLKSESVSELGDYYLNERFGWLRDLCEARAGKLDLHHRMNDLLPLSLGTQLAHMPALFMPVGFLVMQCWILLRLVAADYKILSVVPRDYPAEHLSESVKNRLLTARAA